MTDAVFEDERAPYRARSSDEIGSAKAIPIGRLVEAVRAHRRAFISVTLACLAVGVMLRLTSKPVYVSSAEVIVDPRELQSVNAGATPKIDNADATEAIVGNEMGVLKSNVLLSLLIDKDGLMDDAEFAPRASLLSELRKSVEDLIGIGGVPPSDDIRKVAVVGKLEAVVAVQRRERSFEIDVSVRTQDAEKSAKLANDLVSLYIAQARSTTSALNDRLGSALRDRLSELRARAQEADQRVERFRIDQHLVSAEGVLTSDLRLRTLTDQLAMAQIREGEDRVKAEEVDRARAVSVLGAVPEAVQSPSVMQIRSLLAETLRRRSALAIELGPRHPDLVAVDEQVQTLRKLLDQELVRLRGAIKTQYGRSLRSATTIRSSLDDLSAATLNHSSAVAQLRMLEQEAETARTLFTSFLARSRELNEQTQIYTSNVRQIGLALPALTSSSLPTGLILAFSLLVGVILGTATALLLDLRGGTQDRPRPHIRPSSRLIGFGSSGSLDG